MARVWERNWIGVDLDGTLAHYAGWQGIEHIGAPLAPMVSRVKGWLAEGKQVRIVTARVSSAKQAEAATRAIELWCEMHLGQVLKVTCKKDFDMIELYDDRAVRVEHNTGLVVG